MTERELFAADERHATYAAGLEALRRAGVPFLVGGGYALFKYLGRWRTTKDIDVFVRPDEVRPALDALSRARFQCELTDTSWLAKARQKGALIDIIFRSYNGLLTVDQSWHENGRHTEVLGVPVAIVGPEEMIVSKSFVAARDRFDGADVAWLIRAVGRELNWARIEQLLGEHWMILLWQLVHFLYLFPGDHWLVPRHLVARLQTRLMGELDESMAIAEVCRGALLDPKLYRDDPSGTSFPGESKS